MDVKQKCFVMLFLYTILHTLLEATKIGINGFGRIGRMVFQASWPLVASDLSKLPHGAIPKSSSFFAVRISDEFRPSATRVSSGLSWMWLVWWICLPMQSTLRIR